MGLFSSLGKIAGGFIGGPVGSSIGGALGGAIDGKRSSRGGAVSSSVNYAQLRDNAIKGGFNPLTALRNGGAAGHTTTHTPTLSSKEFIMDALGQGLETAFEYDPKKAQRDEEVEILKRDIMRAELEQIQRQNTTLNPNKNYGYSIPTYSGTGSTHAPIGNTVNTLPNGAVVTQGNGTPSRDLVTPDGRRLDVDENVSTSQDVEDEYSDFAGNIHGLEHYIRDRGRRAIDRYSREHREVASHIDSYDWDNEWPKFSKNKKPRKPRPKQGPRPLHYRQLISPQF